jgi:hypothetical protein
VAGGCFGSGFITSTVLIEAATRSNYDAQSAKEWIEGAKIKRNPTCWYVLGTEQYHFKEEVVYPENNKLI